MFVSFPFLSKINKDVHGKHNASQLEADGQKLEYDIYIKSLGRLANTSPKFQALLDLIAKEESKRRYLLDKNNKKPKRGKLVVCLAFLIISFMMYKVGLYNSLPIRSTNTVAAIENRQLQIHKR